MKANAGDLMFNAVNFFVMLFLSLICLLPIVHILSMSLSDNDAILARTVHLLPVGINFEAYRILFSGETVINTLKNSFVIMIVGTLLNMVFTVMAAYPLSRKYFYFRRFFTMMIVFTMLFNAGMIPNYLLVNALGLVNTYWALWFAVLISAWNMLVMRTFFAQIPEEVEEAARMEGCGEWRLIIQIILPLSIPVIAALSLFYAVMHWNSFLNVFIYIHDSNKHNMTVFVHTMIRNQQLVNQLVAEGTGSESFVVMPESVRSAGIIVLIIPMLVLYPFLQKYFVKGMMIGSIKS